jgi:hypothetical protein
VAIPRRASPSPSPRRIKAAPSSCR